jgi:hypothetical protein
MAQRTKTLINKVLTLRDKGKAAYKEADELLEQVLERLKPGESVELGEGQRATVIDNFANKNKVFRAHGISRFELEVTRAE